MFRAWLSRLQGRNSGKGAAAEKGGQGQIVVGRAGEGEGEGEEERKEESKTEAGEIMMMRKRSGGKKGLSPRDVKDKWGTDVTPQSISRGESEEEEEEEEEEGTERHLRPHRLSSPSWGFAIQHRGEEFLPGDLMAYSLCLLCLLIVVLGWSRTEEPMKMLLANPLLGGPPPRGANPKLPLWTCE